MSNRFTYGNYTFDDSVIVSAEISTEQSLLSEHLSADTLNLIIRSDDVGDKPLYTVLMEWYTTVNNEGFVINDGNLSEYTYGTPITYYRDNVLYGKFFVTQVTRIGSDLFQINAVSAIGLMAYMTHKGGVYTSATAGSIITDIMSGVGVTYTVQQAVSTTVLSGMLPYSNKMANLQQVLFATGASLTKDSSGNIQFVYNAPATAKPIGNDIIREGSGTNVFLAPATRITLTEHQFYQNPNSTAEELYRATSSVTNATIIFSEPVVPSTITADSGITFSEKKATCITFSGTGVIYGIKYTHITSELTWNASNVVGESNEVSVSDATLVTAFNSTNVMNRLVKYYTQRQQTNLWFYTDTKKTGDYVAFDDQFGEAKSGFISKLSLTLGKVVGGNSEVVTNWYPSDQGNNFNTYQLIQSTGTVTVPTAARGKAGRFVLIGGFRGGQGGSAGEGGQRATRGPLDGQGYDIYGGAGGTHGGKGGVGGLGVKVYTFDVASLPSSFSVTAIGAGGQGGAAAAYGETGAMGSLGGNTTMTISGTSYSSASGAENTSGFINFIDGTFYNWPGANGYDNDTGYGGNANYGETGIGGSFSADGQTWVGGAKGESGRTSTGWGSIHGGGGGGAAYGVNGAKGGDGANDNTGRGADGATPITPPQAEFPNCGAGGHGGGCGGGGGSGWQSAQYGPSIGLGYGGDGGAGSPGGQGANGAIIFYYGV